MSLLSCVMVLTGWLRRRELRGDVTGAVYPGLALTGTFAGLQGEKGGRGMCCGWWCWVISCGVPLLWLLVAQRSHSSSYLRACDLVAPSFVCDFFPQLPDTSTVCPSCAAWLGVNWEGYLITAPFGVSGEEVEWICGSFSCWGAIDAT